ncbi:MAG: hypothetical protein MK086_02410 [Flavobacteriales bacterium]|nr:hypothetical protein [Flavobacteriales bacterium]
MKKSALLLLSTLTLQCISAQKDIAQLSAKERFKIAENEKIEAATDIDFQQYMSEGHVFFTQKHYLKAIRSYKKAAGVRPYNVYPKVKIADIELSMKDTLELLRAAEKENLDKPTEQPKDPKLAKPEDKLPETPQETMNRLNNWEQKEREKLEAVRRRKREKEEEPKHQVVSGDVQQLTIEDYRKELGETYPSGVTETVSEEGNKTITTRIVVKKGSGDEYKKVEHNWGGVFFFKNGVAVTERVWDQEATSN